MQDENGYFEDQCPNQNHNHLAVKAFRYDYAHMDQFYRSVHQAKKIQPGFLTSPIVGLTLMRSVQLKRKDIIKCLILEGASVNMLFRGRTLLHFAAKANKPAMISFLLSFDGIDVDKKDVGMVTPLMVAAHGKPKCLKILLEAGCDVHATDLDGLTALHHGILESRSLPDDVIQCLDTLLLHGADINARDKDGETCLHKAIKSNNKWLVKWLISNNCDLNARGPKVKIVYGTLPIQNFPQASPFVLAFQKANRSIIQILMACGCQFRGHHTLVEYCKSYQLLHHHFQKSLKTVESLQSLSRKQIRSTMSTDIRMACGNLGIPVPLQRYILCTDELKLLDF